MKTHRILWTLAGKRRILGLLCLALFCVVSVAARGEPPRDRAEKNAVRAMTGTFDGIGIVLWVAREEARQLLPTIPDLRLDYSDGGDRYPIVLLLGSQQDVGVQFLRGYIHPRYLKHYENAYVIVPVPEASGDQGTRVYILADLRLRRTSRRGREQAQSFAEGPCDDRGSAGPLCRRVRRTATD